MTKLTVLINTAPLTTGHAVRGIGSYTRNLVSELEKIPELRVVRSTMQQEDPVKPDLVHYPFFDLFFNTLPLHLFKKSVVTVHDVIPLVFPEHYKPGLKGNLRFKKQLLALKTASALITDSEHSKKDISKYLGIPSAKIHVVHLAANPELKAQPPKVVANIQDKYNLPKRYVLYVGDINYNKNIPQLIKMLKFLPDEVKLVCVGKQFVPQEIPEWKWIETQIALSNVANRVQFLPNILIGATDELGALYSGAVAYIQPSLYEGFGLPVLEAMQCKTPVVCSEVSSLPEVGGAHALYAQPNAESLAEQVEKILGWSQAKRREWVRAAFDWNTQFSWQKTAQETANVYRSVVREK